MSLQSLAPASLDSLLALITDRLVAEFQPLKIILFGSYARGDADQNSDIDLLVIFSELANKRARTIEILGCLSDLPVAKDVVITTPKEIAEYGHLVGTVLRPALRDGRVIYG
jgi:predicted nucleotidyltransferase